MIKVKKELNKLKRESKQDKDSFDQSEQIKKPVIVGGYVNHYQIYKNLNKQRFMWLSIHPPTSEVVF